MLIRFTKAKRFDKRDILTCVRDDGSITWMRERPGFVYHDLAHYAVETKFGYRYGFFGLVRSGWELHLQSFGRDPVTKKPLPWPDKSGAPMEPVEYVVSLLQREYKHQGIAPEDFHEALKMYVGEKRAAAIPQERLEAARRRLRDLYAEWERVPASEALELEFAI